MNADISKRLKSRAKIEKEKQTVRPTVINDILIRQYLVQYNRDNKVFDENDKPLWELTHLALSYKNIIEIDNLQGMEKLQKLQLDNNIICKIQNMEKMVNLKWLDLSFNLVEKIEGLDTLVNLQDLSLYSNRIQLLGGLENLTKLNVFSFGQNLVSNHINAILYLKTLKNKLEVLKMAENPFFKAGAADQDYSLYAIEFLEKLKYLDYKLISEKKREEARVKYSEDKLTEQGQNQEEEETEIDQELIDAKIGNTEGMLDRISNLDEESQKLKNLASYDQCWDDLKQVIDEQTGTFQNQMKYINKQKKNHIQYCSTLLRKSEIEAEQQSVELIRKFNSFKKHKLKELETLDDKALQIDDYSDTLKDAVSTLEDNLMEIEMILQDALAEATGKFRDKIMQLNSEMKGKTMDYMKYVLEQSELFQAELKNKALDEQAKFEAQFNQEQANNEEAAIQDDDSEFNMKLDLLGERDPLVAMLDIFQELFVNSIGEQERTVTKGITDEWDQIDKSIISQQHSRNRGVVKEIIETCQDFKNNLNDKFEKMRDEFDNE